MRTHSDERVLTCESMEPADKSAYADWMAKAQAYWDQEDSDGEVEYVDFDGPTVHPATPERPFAHPDPLASPGRPFTGPGNQFSPARVGWFPPWSRSMGLMADA
jgi:hypothetical protein